MILAANDRPSFSFSNEVVKILGGNNQDILTKELLSFLVSAAKTIPQNVSEAVKLLLELLNKGVSLEEAKKQVIEDAKSKQQQEEKQKEEEKKKQEEKKNKKIIHKIERGFKWTNFNLLNMHLLLKECLHIYVMYLLLACCHIFYFGYPFG